MCVCVCVVLKQNCCCCCCCRLPIEQRRGYKNVFDALYRMSREEGVTTLWRVSRFDLCCDGCG